MPSRGVEDFWRVYDAHFEQVFARAQDALREHPQLRRVVPDRTPEERAAAAIVHRERLRSAFHGDPAPRAAFVRQTAETFAAAGVDHSAWALFDEVFAETVIPLLVAAYANEPDRLAGALQALHRHSTETAMLFSAAYLEQKQVALLESENRYRQLLETSPESILVHVDGRVQLANDAAARTLGLSRGAELVGRRLTELRRPVAGDSTPATKTHETVERTYVTNAGAEVTLEELSLPFAFEGRDATFTVSRNVTLQRKAEAAARSALDAADRERRRLTAILDELPVGVWIVDAAGRVTFANAAASGILQARAPRPDRVEEYEEHYELISTATGEPVPFDAWPMVRTLRTGEAVSRELYDIPRVDGSRRHVLFSSVQLPEFGAEERGAILVGLDVTELQDAIQERERLVRSLDFERHRLATLFQEAPAGIAVMRGPEHVVELANEEACRFAGTHDLVGKRASDAVPLLRTQGIIELYDRVLATGEPFIGRALPVDRPRTEGGPPERIFLDVVYQVILDANGTRSGVFNHAVDVTEREEALQRMRAQFKAMPIPTYAWRRTEVDGRTNFVLHDYNDAAATFTQGRVATMIGERASETFGEHGAAAVKEMERCLTERRTLRREMVHKMRETGEPRQLVVTYTYAPPDTVLVHTEDVTDRRRLEEQLRNAQKMEAIGRLAGGVAHDFNNILSVILGYTSLMRDELSAADPLRADVLEMEAAAQRAVALTQQLLALGRKQVLQPRKLDLASSVRGLEPMLRRLLGEGIELTITAGPDPSPVFADPTQIDQVILNLTVNARDAMPTGGALSIVLDEVALGAADVPGDLELRPGRYALLAMRDSGTGMDSATLERIFEPFFTTKEQGKGTGLGLATVLGIVRQSGGFVKAESAPGEGTTFRIYLPYADDGAGVPASGPASGHAEAPRGEETILLVEDDRQVRTLVASVLRRQGYRVLDAPEGGDALALVASYEGTIDLLLTDVVMPRMSGRELAERAAAIRPKMKVLFMSGYTDDAIVRHGVATSGIAFLQKPVTASALARKVRAVLDERDQERQ